jgi:hypothetical protein
MVTRCVSLDDETDGLVRARSAGSGEYSDALRELVRQAHGNHQRLRHALRGACSAIRMNTKLLRDSFGRAGSMRFLEEIELANKQIEAVLAKA